jgi:proteasome lid subunit RPN8/RPN11
MASLFSVPGMPIQAEELRHALPRALVAHFVSRHDGAFELHGCSAAEVNGRVEILHLNVRPALPQGRLYDFRAEEPVFIVFYASRDLPDVFSLRRDFPRVPHTNLIKKGTPSWICLFGEDPDEVRRRLTPQLLTDRILWWFEKNAVGGLHRDDQALEPFLVGQMRPIYFPRAVFESSERTVLPVYGAYRGTQQEVLVADLVEDIPPELRGEQAALYPFLLPIQTEGVIYEEPETLADLIDLCSQASFDLVTHLSDRLRSDSFLKPTASMTILLFGIPKGRRPGSDVEAVDFRAFRLLMAANNGTSDISPGQLAAHLGLGWLSPVGAFTPRIGSYVSSGAARSVAVTLLSPMELTTRAQAAWMNGLDMLKTPQVVAVGCGALGSQVFGHLARKSFGRWTLIDVDRLEPHNLARHLVFGRRYGFFKADELAHRANELFKGDPIARPIVADIGFPGDKRGAIQEALNQADLVVDMTASTAAARRLQHDYKSDAPKCSLFLSPSGHDLVALFEGRGQPIPLDILEMQYLRDVVNDVTLEGLLTKPDGALRYGPGCRDRSSRLRNELVALHAAIGSNCIERFSEGTEPRATVWRCDPETMEVRKHEVPLRPSTEISFREWSVLYDEGLLEKLHGFRRERLPRETCGVLLGQLDPLRSRLYLVDALSAPADSEESEGWCKRGVAGLADAVQSINVMTGGDLEYVGEWHSHPNRSSCRPSHRDLDQLAWIRDRMHPAGLPAVILIVCEGATHTILVDVAGLEREEKELR